jgi:hypothetical protein
MSTTQVQPWQEPTACSGLNISFFRDPDVDAKISGISSVEEVARSNGA